VLLNLVGNAIKFTEAGDITVSRQALNQQRAGSCSVSKSAIPASACRSEQQAQLFAAFTQADTSTTRKYGGTGLGLSICKRIVDQLGGKISVSSQPGTAASLPSSCPLNSPPTKPKRPPHRPARLAARPGG
jgi:two-component system sensor histidine kinase/response regulator